MESRKEESTRCKSDPAEWSAIQRELYRLLEWGQPSDGPTPDNKGQLRFRYAEIPFTVETRAGRYRIGLDEWYSTIELLAEISRLKRLTSGEVLRQMLGRIHDQRELLIGRQATLTEVHLVDLLGVPLRIPRAWRSTDAGPAYCRTTYNGEFLFIYLRHEVIQFLRELEGKFRAEFLQSPHLRVY